VLQAEIDSLRARLQQQQQTAVVANGAPEDHNQGQPAASNGAAS
jgi:hypothetical protein